MSHDRGCPCGRERYEYDDCDRPDCYKKPNKQETVSISRSEPWDDRFLALADHIADWSKDPSTKVGAVIVRPNRTIASVGYNGFPRGVDDTLERLNDRPTKYAMTVHAEANAILSAGSSVAGCTLYVTPLHPCSNCAALIIQSGIAKVVARMPDNPAHWAESFAAAKAMFYEAGIEVIIKS